MQLLLLLSLFFFSLTFGSPSDVLYIKKLTADVAQSLDSKDFAQFVNFFTNNVIYKRGGSSPIINGTHNVKAALADIHPPEVITQTAINTESITLLPPFDEQGAAGRARGVVYVTASYIGQGNLTSQVAVYFAKFEDEYVKTGNIAPYGGWRISRRFFINFVSYSKVKSLETYRGGTVHVVTIYVP